MVFIFHLVVLVIVIVVNIVEYTIKVSLDRGR